MPVPRRRGAGSKRNIEPVAALRRLQGEGSPHCCLVPDATYNQPVISTMRSERGRYSPLRDNLAKGTAHDAQIAMTRTPGFRLPHDPIEGSLTSADDRVRLDHWLPPQTGVVP